MTPALCPAFAGDDIEVWEEQECSDWVSPDRPYQLRGMELVAAFDAIAKLVKSQHSWAGTEVEPPTPDAADCAMRICERLSDKGLLPDRIIASGDGGVALCFVRNDLYADIECLNTGTIVASTAERSSGIPSKVWSFDLGNLNGTISTIRSFLGG